ncbi:hypothetical protein DIS24_g6172 [Lasiodiplodia hormozganensis]|uniref:Uncharacterized protein n=1 Tax=Lasiodiplodia hormozganensis TaxID=869390 RepID=A0AA39YIT2_9PEZI|nr:hypothetical protein DIS24_g6172 [Lasiodiplodia hormozganensis]
MDAGQAPAQSDFLYGFNGQNFGHLPASLQNTDRPLDSLDATAQSQVQQHFTPYQAVMPTSMDPRFTYQTSMDQPSLDQNLMCQTNTNQPSRGQTYPNQLFTGQTYPNQLFTGQTNMNQPSAENPMDQTNQLFTSQTYPNQPSAKNLMNQTYPNQLSAENLMGQTYPNQLFTSQTYSNQPSAENFMEQTNMNQPFADQNLVHQTFPTQTSMPPATEPPIRPSERLVSDTAMVYYNNLTQVQKTRIMDQASKLSDFMKLFGVGPNYDPVMVYCRYRARKDLANGLSQPAITQQPLQSRPEPYVPTSLPQPTGCSPGSPIVIEECAVPAATTPRPKLVDVTDRMYSEYPDENDFIHPAYSVMMWMDKFKEDFQLNRVARSHRWYVREDDRTKFSCTRSLDGVTTVAWQLEAKLNELEHGRAESNRQKEQREQQQTAEEAARKEESERKAAAEAQQKAAEKAARKEESKKRAQANRRQKAEALKEKTRKETAEAQQKAAEEAARKEEAERKAAADHEQQDRERREERDTAPQRSKRKATDSEENSSPKKARLDIDPLSEEEVDSLFEERDGGDYNDNDDEEEDQELVDSCTNLLEMDDDDEEDQELVDSCINLLEMDDDDDDGNKQKSVDTDQDESGEEVRDLQYDLESEESEEE